MAVSSPRPYFHTNKRQMYGSQSTQALLSYKYETSVWQSVHPTLPDENKFMLISGRSVRPAREAKPHLGAALVRFAHDCETCL